LLALIVLALYLLFLLIFGHIKKVERLVGKRTKQIDKSKIPGETALLNAVFVGYGIAFSRSF